MTPLKTTPEERLALGLETLHQRIHASYERHDACMGEPPDWQPRSNVVAHLLDDLDTLAASHARSLAIADIIEHDLALASMPKGGQQVGPSGDLGPVPPSVRRYLDRIVRDLRDGEKGDPTRLDTLAAEVGRLRAALEEIDDGACETPSYADGCDKKCRSIAFHALKETK